MCGEAERCAEHVGHEEKCVCMPGHGHSLFSDITCIRALVKSSASWLVFISTAIDA